MKTEDSHLSGIVVISDRTGIIMARTIRIDHHCSAWSHPHNLSKAKRPSRSGPSTIDVVVNLRSRLVPESAVIGGGEADVYASSRRTVNWRRKLKVAAACAAIKRVSRRIPNSVSGIARGQVVTTIPAVIWRDRHWRCGRILYSAPLAPLLTKDIKTHCLFCISMLFVCRNRRWITNKSWEYIRPPILPMRC